MEHDFINLINQTRRYCKLEKQLVTGFTDYYYNLLGINYFIHFIINGSYWDEFKLMEWVNLFVIVIDEYFILKIILYLLVLFTDFIVRYIYLHNLAKLVL